ncbi:OmpH family outer membrane protein [Sphingomonas sabuli]|uniref:OmpH family outer membrane protein n=1 Tax=Sphingomonas sabuli TaxID=2764186 RepID=A0A7G9L3L5_9SPHN|nr:OmpH family outer membrane protein [Sphingomonas sabuli]QNM83214.1 OmpH family outer membrane protein [Sphingomonas sabuli]
MKKFFVAAAFAATAVSIPTVASAQRPPIIMVDTDTIMETCTACVSARSQIQQKETALRTRAQTLRQQIETEGKPIQDTVDKLGDKAPDAALQARIRAFQTKQQQASQEIETTQRTLQSTAAHVQQQIGVRLISVVEQVRARRGAMIALSKSATLANDNSIDVTAEVLSGLNSALPSVSVTPLPQQAQPQQQQPQGR